MSDDFDIKFENNLNPERGKILISEPFLEDDYFKRSVVLLCDHNEEGSFGFVLNHYIDAEVSSLIPDFPEIDVKVSIGGPVSTSNVYYIHSLGDSIEGSKEVYDGIYMGGEFAQIKEAFLLGKASSKNVRFFIGYSGWSSGQLEEEISDHAWRVAQSSHDEIMNTKIDKLWKKTMARQGEKYKMMSDFPPNFRLN